MAILKVSEACEYLKISDSSIYRYIEQGMKHKIIDGVIHVDTNDVIKYRVKNYQKMVDNGCKQFAKYGITTNDKKHEVKE